MAFEELTSLQAVMWGSAPFENIADLISDMQVALVEHLEQRAAFDADMTASSKRAATATASASSGATSSSPAAQGLTHDHSSSR